MDAVMHEMQTETGEFCYKTQAWSYVQNLNILF